MSNQSTELDQKTILAGQVFSNKFLPKEAEIYITMQIFDLLVNLAHVKINVCHGDDLQTYSIRLK